MALVLKDRVRQTSTTAGTGTLTLSGSVTGYQSFSVIGTGNTTYYTITDASGNWEVGLGTYTSPNQLSRDTVYESSNSNNKVNFSSASKDVFVTFPAEAVTTGGVTGSGTAGYLPKFATSTSVGDSKLLQAGTTILTQRNAAPTLITSSGTTLSASAVCSGYVQVDFPLFIGDDAYLPTGSALDAELGLSGSLPINVTFDCIFCNNYPSNTAGNFSIIGNTGNSFVPGNYWGDWGSTYPNGKIDIADSVFNCSVVLRFYRTGNASYTIYPVVL